MHQRQGEQTGQAYKQKLKKLHCIAMVFEICFFMIRIYKLKIFSLVCSIEIIQILLLVLLNCPKAPFNECKLYIILAFGIFALVFYNWIGALTDNFLQKDMFFEDFTTAEKKMIYPCQLLARIFSIIVVWRIYQFNWFKIIIRRAGALQQDQSQSI